MFEFAAAFSLLNWLFETAAAALTRLLPLVDEITLYLFSSPIVLFGVELLLIEELAALRLLVDPVKTLRGAALLPVTVVVFVYLNC